MTEGAGSWTKPAPNQAARKLFVLFSSGLMSRKLAP